MAWLTSAPCSQSVVRLTPAPDLQLTAPADALQGFQSMRLGTRALGRQPDAPVASRYCIYFSDSPIGLSAPPSLAAYSGPLYPGFSPESSPFTSCSLGLSTQGGLFLISLHLSSFQAIQPSGYDGLSCLWAIVSCSSTHQHRLCTWVLLFKIQVFKACRELNKRTQSCNYC